MKNNSYLRIWLLTLLITSLGCVTPFIASAAPPAHPGTVIVPPDKKPLGLNQPQRITIRQKGKIRRIGEPGKRSSPLNGEFGASRLSTVEVPSLGGSTVIRPLVLLLSFADNAFSTTTAASYPAFLFSDSPGLSDYYEEVSGGKLLIAGDGNSVYFVDMSAGARSYDYYINGQSGFGAYPQNAQRMVEDALILADPWVNFADFDNDGPDGISAAFGSIDDDGMVDALVVAHAGPAGEYFTQPEAANHMASHYWFFSSGSKIHDETEILDWAMVPETDPDDPGNWHFADYTQTLGTVAHEFGHILGLPDLYDTDLSSYGLGHYGLMSYGTYGTNTDTETYFGLWSDWDRPGYPAAWSRVYLGWVESVALHADTQVALWRAEDPTPLDHPQVLKVWTSISWAPMVPWEPREYFLMEHRQSAPGTYDEGFNLNGEGAVLVYHVDETVLMPGGVPDPSPNDNELRKGVDLEEADGLAELDMALGTSNYGQFTDFYRQGFQGFYNTTNPDSKDNSGTATDITVRDDGGLGNGFGPASESSLSDYLMTVNLEHDFGYAKNGIGYSGTTRAGPFVVTGGTFDDGDDDAWITAGKVVRLELNIKHAGIPNTARGVRALIDSPYFASVSTSSVDFGDLPALAESTGSGEFIFTMAQPSAAFTWFSVTVQMIDDNLNFSQEILQLPVVRAAKKKDGGGGPCFIATAMWGTDHWRTNRLRAVRDKYLLKNQTGREVVDFYYKTSPPLADWLKGHPRIRTTTEFILTRLLWPFFL